MGYFTRNGLDTQDQEKSDYSIDPGLSSVGLGAAKMGVGFGLNAAGLPSSTATGLLDSAATGYVDAAKTSLNVAKDVAKMSSPYGGLIGGALEAGYQGATKGLGAGLKSIGKMGMSVAGSVLGGPLGSIAGGLLAGLAIDSFEEGGLGDAFGTRDQEGARDRAENFGYSQDQTSDAAAVDRDRSRENSIDPGLGSRGYGLSPGLSDIDPYGGYSLGSMAFDGYDDGGGNDSGGGSSVVMVQEVVEMKVIVTLAELVDTKWRIK